MKIKSVLLMLILLFSGTAFAEELTATKKAAIKELMDVTGSAQVGQLFADSFIQQMAKVMKSSNPDIPPKTINIMKEEVNGLIHEEMVVKKSFYELLYPVYHKYLTLDELRTLIAFYKTPVGKKTITVMPRLVQESMQVGQVWGQSLGPKIEKRLSKRLKEEGLK